MQPPEGKKLVASSVESLTRLAAAKQQASSATDTTDINAHAERLIRPKSLTGTMRKVGVALVATPDPFTGVPGVALIAASFVAKKREPIGLAQLALETRRVLRDIQSLSV